MGASSGLPSMQQPFSTAGLSPALDAQQQQQQQALLFQQAMQQFQQPFQLQAQQALTAATMQLPGMPAQPSFSAMGQMPSPAIGQIPFGFPPQMPGQFPGLTLAP